MSESEKKPSLWNDYIFPIAGWLVIIFVFAPKLYTYFTGSSGNVAISSKNGPNIASRETLLERLTDFGTSTRQQYSEFIDEGGLSKNFVWNGFYITQAQFSFGQDNRVTKVYLKIAGFAEWRESLQMWRRGEDASPRQVREKLSQVCGVSGDSWELNESSGYGSGNQNGGSLECVYGVGVSNDITVNMSWTPL